MKRFVETWLDTGKCIFIFFGEASNMNVTMTWRSDGSVIASGIRLSDASVSLVDLKDARAVCSLQ